MALLSAKSPGRYQNCCSYTNRLDFHFPDLAVFALPVSFHIMETLDLPICGLGANARYRMLQASS